VTAHDHICPHCGYDLVRNGPIIIDNWSMLGPGYPLCYKGKPVRLTNAESEIVYSLLKAFPKHIERWVLIERIGSDTDAPSNLLTVYISRIKSRLEHAGLPLPIATVWGHGYRWLREGEIVQTKAAIEPRITSAAQSSGRRPRKTGS
jgi:DNA-binding response OmpR family regulator